MIGHWIRNYTSTTLSYLLAKKTLDTEGNCAL